MSASQGDTPAAARRRVRLALRRGRRGTGLSQGSIAQRLGWSLSKMQRIESGEVSVSGTDLRALLDVYGVADEEQIDRLLEDARISRRQRWWTAPEFREHLTRNIVQLLQFEAEAAAIHVFQPHVVPGVLQTPEMAENILAWWNAELSDEVRRARFDARMLRKKQITERPDPPEYSLILDEVVLNRKVGGARVMAEQLEELAEAAQRPNVHIRVLAIDHGGMVGGVGPFTLMDMDEEDPDDAILYLEYGFRDEIVHDVQRTRQSRAIFERIWALSYDESASLRRITAQAAVLRASLD
jgi:transcriptional regulator with XRE-family HTH domain